MATALSAGREEMHSKKSGGKIDGRIIRTAVEDVSHVAFKLEHYLRLLRHGRPAITTTIEQLSTGSGLDAEEVRLAASALLVMKRVDDIESVGNNRITFYFRGGNIREYVN